MMKNSAKSYFLCDSSKIGHIFLNTLCNVSDIDEIICEATAYINESAFVGDIKETANLLSDDRHI